MFRTPHRIALVLAVLSKVHCSLNADTNSPASLALWDRTVNLRGALGYKDNVLLSKNAPEGSAFWQSAVDFSVVRLALDNSPNLTFFVSGEDRRYFSSSEVSKEQLLLSQAKISKDLTDEWTAAFVAQYLYADQVFDASSTEQVQEILPVKSQNIQITPSVTRALPWNSSVELKLTGERQIFESPLDSYWEAGPEIVFKKKYGHKSEASLAYTLDYRLYDTRNTVTTNFEVIPNTSLRFLQHEFELALYHSWDRARHWRTRTRVLFEINGDNGTGYYNYNRYRFTQRLGYYGKNWEATIEGKVLHYDFSRQPGTTGGGLRQTWEYVLAVRGERTIWRTVKVFLESETDKMSSNYFIEQYLANTVMTGFDWEF